jgi:Methylamine utilisation protein MauE
VFGLVARFVAAFVLAGSAALKLASPGSSRAALATFEVEGERLRWIGWAILVATELGLAIAIAAGSDAAAWLAAGLMALFAAALVGAILRGRAGAPCACFGSRSTVGWTSVARNLALASGFAVLPLLPERTLSTDQWLGLGLVLALVMCVALGIAVLALAREVGVLRLRLGPAAALEIPEEGPEPGERVAVIERFARHGHASLALAVFTSAGCRVCRGLEPAIAAIAGDPTVAVETFDEVEDRDVWSELGVPGSPFAIALEPNGIVLAKGTFNNLAQLESVLATAEHRRPGLVAASGDG